MKLPTYFDAVYAVILCSIVLAHALDYYITGFLYPLQQFLVLVTCFALLNHTYSILFAKKTED